MNFGYALERLWAGDAVRLPTWSADVAIRLQIPDEHSKMTAPYLYVQSRHGRVPWLPTQIELLSDNWTRAGS